MTLSWLAHPLANAIGWTLLHSLWQGAIIAMVLGVVLAVSRQPRLRYGVSLAAMAAMLSCWGVTLATLWPSAPATFRIAAIPLPAHPAALGADFAQAPFSVQSLVPWLAPLWMAGVITLLLRHTAGFLALTRLKTRGVCDPPPEWQHVLTRLAAQLRISRPVRLLESALVEAPVVLGHLRPLVLVPAGFLAQLPVEQIEAILLHELAHIRRNDYLVNLIQRLAEAILFYHPAAWWISQRLRIEREYCCDDIAIGAHGNAFTYASALTALELHRSGAPKLALGATGGSLMKRIQRILQPTRPATPALALLPAAALLIAAAVSLAAWQADKSSPMPKSPEAAAEAAPVNQLPSPEEMARMRGKALRLLREEAALRKGYQLAERDYRALLAQQQQRAKAEDILRAVELGSKASDLMPDISTLLDQVDRQVAQASVSIDLEKMNRAIAGTEREVAAASNVIAEFGRELQTEDTALRLERMARIAQELKQGAARTRDEQQLRRTLERPRDEASSNSQLLKPPPQDPGPSPTRTPYDLWLNEDVSYIVSEAERAAFLRLSTDEERKMFIEQFWLRRDPTPGTPANEMQTEHYRRVGYAMERFVAPNGQRGWRTDRGRVYIQYGPPDEREEHPSGGPSSAFPYEAWRYRRINGVGDNVTLVFVDQTRTGDYRWTQDPNRR